MERLIVPVEGDWDTVISPADRMSRWEQSTGFSLPADYRRFMAKYDGGRVYPCLLDLEVPDEDIGGYDRETMHNAFFPWSMVEDIASGGSFGQGLPTGMLAIGSDPGEVVFLLCIEGDDYGKVFSWFRSHSAWGSSDNGAVWKQADSFSNFLESFYEDEARTGHQYWHTPMAARIARTVEY